MNKLLPQLAKQAEVSSLDTYINDDSWVLEQKLDGHRLLLVDPEMDLPPTALTRSGSFYTRRLPKAIQDFRFPNSSNAGSDGIFVPWVLDGELVGEVVNGHTVSSTYWVFDLPSVPGMAEMPLYQRRQVLETLLANIRHPFKLIPQARTRAEKQALAERAVKTNAEGLIAKKIDSVYRPGGRTPEWVKLKFVATVDVVVTSVRDDGKDSVAYAIYDQGVLRPVGRASLIGKEKNGAIQVGDILEIRYLYVGNDGRLYQPTVLRKRDPNEKRRDECTADQLKFVNKTVLASL